MKKERDHKRFLAPRDLWDVGTIEAWLEEKAAQGWILERWGTWAKFQIKMQAFFFLMGTIFIAIAVAINFQ